MTRFFPLFALILGFASWASMLAWMQIPSVRATLWPSWLLALAGLALALYTFTKLRPLTKLRIAGATLGLAFSGLWILNVSTGLRSPARPAGTAPLAKFPALKVKDLEGNEITLPAGKPTLLVFFRGFWCPACVIELRGLGAVQAELKSRGGEVIAITTEPADRVKPGLVSYPDLPVKLALDTDKSVVKTLQLEHDLNGEIYPAPANILLDETGAVRWEHYPELVTGRPDPKLVLEQVRKLDAK